MGNAQRGREYRRYVRNKTILRKKCISHLIYGFDWYNHDGKYARARFIAAVVCVNMAGSMACLRLKI